MTHTLSLIPGDGVGPEVTTATKRIIDETGVKIDWEICDAGAKVFEKGLATGVPQETIDSIVKNKMALKGPLSTPVGFGEKSANVTLRKFFETYGNIRPIREIKGINTPYQGRGIDLIIVRENLEDLYAGIEYMQTPGVSECLKIISRKGSEKIIRLAFEVARSENRKKVSCATKANIMKLSEGLFKKTFEDVSKDYPDIQAEHIIVDNAAHQLVKKPEQFDVLVTTNMNGDILSDLGSALIGGLGFAPGANIGDTFAIFEAVHGTAPKYAGQNTINPTATLLSGVMMLRYLNEFEAANLIEQSLYRTIAVDHIQTRDTNPNNPSSTSQFADKIIDNLGKPYDGYTTHPYKQIQLPCVSKDQAFVKPKNRQWTGVDVFLESSKDPNVLGLEIQKALDGSAFDLHILSSRGIKLYPNPMLLSYDGVDLITARFKAKSNQSLTDDDVFSLLKCLQPICTWTHVEKLNVFDDALGFTKVHGEA